MSKIAELHPRPIVRTNADPTVHRIIPELASEIGLNESIFLMQIAFWISGKGGEFHDGRWWTYQSTRKMADDVFIYWSHSTINRIAKKLIKDGYLIEGDYNKKSYDKTRWFALNVNQIQNLKSLTVVDNAGQVFIEIIDDTLYQNDTRSTQDDTGSNQNDTRSTQDDTTIPETSTETSTNTKDSATSADEGDNTPEEIIDSPIVEEAKKVIVEEKAKKRDRIFDGVSLYSFKIDATKPESQILFKTKGTAARIGKIVSWLKALDDEFVEDKLATELWQFYQDWKHKYTDASPPRDLTKFSEHYIAFRQSGTHHTDNFNNTSKPTAADYAVNNDVDYDNDFDEEAIAKLLERYQ